MVGNIVLAFGFVLLVIYLWKKSKGALIGLFVCIAVLAIGMHYGIEPSEVHPTVFPCQNAFETSLRIFFIVHQIKHADF